MKDNNKIIFLTIATILIIVFVFVYIMLWKSNKEECMKSPFTYGAEKISKDNLEVTCACYFNDANYAPFYFNKNNISIGKPLD